MNEQKRKYRVTNWRAYNAALVARGSLTLWFDEAAVAGWYEAERTGRRDAPRRYAEVHAGFEGVELGGTDPLNTEAQRTLLADDV